MGTNIHNTLKLKIMPSKARLKFLKFKKINILFMLIITVQIFSLCFPCLEKVRTKFPVFPVPWPPCMTTNKASVTSYSSNCIAQYPFCHRAYLKKSYSKTAKVQIRTLCMVCCISTLIPINTILKITFFCSWWLQTPTTTAQVENSHPPRVTKSKE